MRKDHRPYAIKKAYLRFQTFYTDHFLRPQLEGLGRGFVFMRPWHVALFGGPITIGDFATVIAAPDKKVRLSVWPDENGRGGIEIGRFNLISPGVRISSAARIVIEDNCMLANGVYITDSDWHGIYDRISFGRAAPVRLKKNVWVGDSAIVCKGVTIGENSVIGAGAIVVDDVPDNCIAVGNPATVVKHLDPDTPFTTRADWYKAPARLDRQFVLWEQAVSRDNTLLGWLRHLLFPTRGD
jgi:acetyltransferase-like isoleucine patch superfamily enzyme